MNIISDIKSELELSLEEARLLIVEMEGVADENELAFDLNSDIYWGQGLSWGIDKLEASIDLIAGQGVVDFFGITSLSYQHELIEKSENIKNKLIELKEKYEEERSRENSEWESIYKNKYRLSNRYVNNDFEPLLKECLRLIDFFIKDFFLLFLYFDNKNAPVIDNLIRYFNDELNRVREASKSSYDLILDLENVVDNSKVNEKNIEKLNEESQGLFSDIEEGKERVDSIRNDLELKFNEASDFLQTNTDDLKRKYEDGSHFIESVNGQCRDFEKTIAEKEGILAAFEGSIELKDSRHEQALAKNEALLESFTAKEGVIAELIDKAEKMLSSSTAAGLAHHFGKTKEELDAELKGAKNGVWISIGILGFLSIPLIVLILYPLFPLLSFIFPNSDFDWKLLISSEPSSSWSYLGQAFGRAVVILPGIWLVVFSSSRYNAIFKLREHYSYKYTMAVSVDGFKKQAAGYESEIAAMVFDKIGFNPADKMDSKDSDISKGFEEKCIAGAVLNAIKENIFRKKGGED